MLLLTLPGPAFIYQGDEIGMSDGPGRQSHRLTEPAVTHSAARCNGTPEPGGGFTAGVPWLPLADPEACSVAAQRDEPRLDALALPSADRGAPLARSPH